MPFRKLGRKVVNLVASGERSEEGQLSKVFESATKLFNATSRKARRQTVCDPATGVGQKSEVSRVEGKRVKANDSPREDASRSRAELRLAPVTRRIVVVDPNDRGGLSKQFCSFFHAGLLQLFL